MVRIALLCSLLFSLGARADGLVFTTDVPAGTAVTPELVRRVKVPAAMQSLTVSAESFSFLTRTVLRFAVRKGDLVLWSAFAEDLDVAQACQKALGPSTPQR